MSGKSRESDRMKVVCASANAEFQDGVDGDQVDLSVYNGRANLNRERLKRSRDFPCQELAMIEKERKGKGGWVCFRIRGGECRHCESR
jgi:hypothetical protein